MPNFNQTGPMGQGSMTGKKMGNCLENPIKNNSDDTFQNGRCQGRGKVRGRRCRNGQGFGMGQ